MSVGRGFLSLSGAQKEKEKNTRSIWAPCTAEYCEYSQHFERILPIDVFAVFTLLGSTAVLPSISVLRVLHSAGSISSVATAKHSEYQNSLLVRSILGV